MPFPDLLLRLDCPFVGWRCLKQLPYPENLGAELQKVYRSDLTLEIVAVELEMSPVCR